MCTSPSNPAEPAKVCSDPSVPGPNGTSKRKGRVLVIDDEPLILRAFSRALAQAHVTACGRPTQALELLTAGERYDLILCDVMMPALNGLQFLEALCLLAPEQVDHVVFCTAGIFDDALRDQLHALPNKVLPKPIATSVLRQLLAAAVGA